MNATHPTRIAFGPRAPLTDRLFLRLCGANPELRLERTAQGDLIVMTPAGAEAGGREAALVHQLMAWNDAHARGVVFGPSAGFALPNGAIRSPDVSWIARDRWDAIPPQRRRGFAPLCPDFVAELRSPTDRRRDLRAKMREYRACGARLGWLIDPTRRVVEVYRPGADRVTLTDPATLPGEDRAVRAAVRHAGGGLSARGWDVVATERSPVLGTRGAVEWLIHARRRRSGAPRGGSRRLDRDPLSREAGTRSA